MAQEGFLFGNKLVTELEELIKESKHYLLLISPFIDLSPRLKDVLIDKLERHDFELRVLFGKNEHNIYKSIKNDSIDFFKKFPNCEIRYNDRLHAKFYMSDYNYIVTSMNLYNFSLDKNIEVGLQYTHASKGLLGKAVDSSVDFLDDKVQDLKKNVFGTNQEVNPIDEFKKIFEESELKYKTLPLISGKGGVKGFIGQKKLDGCTVEVDELNAKQSGKIGFTQKKEEVKKHDVKIIIPTNTAKHSKATGPAISASKLSKELKCSIADINSLMQDVGFVSDNEITSTGEQVGLVRKSYMGNDYIAYPNNLEVLNKLN